MNASTDTSGPVRNSSTTTLFPELPNFLSSIISLTAAFASVKVFAMITPLPSANPSAFMTTGKCPLFSIYSIAFAGSLKVSYSAVGMPYFFIRFFEKTLLLSMIAALARGPNALIPLAINVSTMPSANGSSGATNTKSTAFSFENATIPSLSIALILIHSASFAIPPFPGAAYILSTFGLSFSFLIMACSLPPLPTTSILMANPPSMVEQANTRKCHCHVIFITGVNNIVVTD